MNLISDGNFRGLRKLSILATSLVLLVFAGLLVLRGSAPTAGPEPRKSEYARYETEPKPEIQRPPATREETEPDRTPEKNANLPQLEKKLAAAKLMNNTASPIVATAGGGPDRFTLRDRNANAFFTDSGISFAFIHGKEQSSQGFALKWGLDGAKEVSPRPEGERETKVNRMIGDQSTWQFGLSSYTQMVYDQVRPGVDMTIEARPQGLKYTLQVAPGADASNLKFRYEGSTGVSVAKDGQSMKVAMGKDIITESDLIVWQETAAGRIAVDASYEQAGADGYVIRVGEYDKALPLMVDPLVSWATFLGGRSAYGGSEYGYAIAADSATNSYVGGYTGSVDFPTTAGAYQINYNGGQDSWVAKFNSAGGLVWSTLFGGSDADYLYGLKLDNANNVVVCGYTYSRNFPTTAGTYQPVCPPGNSTQRAWVAKFNGGTGALTWSTYVSGPGNTGYTACNSVALDPSNNVYIAGSTSATDYPLVNPAFNTIKGGSDAFVTKLDANAQTIAYSTFIGSGGYDVANGIAVDPAGSAYITGYTDGGTLPLFPTTAGAYRTTPYGSSTGDAFVSKFNPTGGLAWSTYIGSTAYDVAYAIGLDNATPPNVYITGYTGKATVAAGDWPTTAGAFRTVHDLSYDGFLTKINSAGTGLVWSTFIGGSDYDIMYGLVVSSVNQDVYVCGGTYSTNMPVAMAVDSVSNGGEDGYFCRFNSAGTFLYGSYLGGNSYEYCQAIGEYNGWVWLTGGTSSPNFLISAGAYQNTLRGGQDAFITRVDAFGVNILNWSTFFGGTYSQGSQDAVASAIDPNGNVYVTGTSYTLDYPTTPGAIQSVGSGGTDIVISKISNAGTAPLLWSTYFGGATDEDFVTAITTNLAGEAFITGYTYSTDFPYLGGGQSTLRGGTDAFVSHFNNDGTLNGSTYIGGATSDEYAYGIAVDSSNFVYIVGDTYSTDYYMVNPYKNFLTGSGDIFVSKLNLALNQLLYSTYLGGNSSEHAVGIAVDSTGAAYISGHTQSPDYPIVAGAYSATFDTTTGFTPFVTKFTPAGNALQFSTFYGGSSYEYPYGIALDNAQNVYVCGYTNSPNFPTPGGFQTLFAGNSDGYVVKFNPSGSNIVWATFLGGSQFDLVQSIAVDSQQNVYCTGQTSSTNFPMTPPLLNSVAPGNGDAFACRINAQGNTLSWSTYLGGNNGDYGMAVSVGQTGNVTVFGGTNSSDFPVTGGAIQPTLRGASDFFIVRINNEAPSGPGPSLTQYRSNQTTVIATGGATNETTVVMKGLSNDAEGDKYKLQVEVRPIGTAFTSPATVTTLGVDFFESGFVNPGTTAVVTVGGRTAGTQYHWQARSVDANGAASAWNPYGGNTENPPTNPAANDFRVDQTVPSISISTPNGTGTYYTNLSSVALGGTSADNVGVFSVTWVNAANSLNGTASGTTSWTVPGVNLTAGSNVITMTATDTAGNTATAVINVIQDMSPPTITITGPTSNPTFITSATTTAAPNTVQGTYSDNIGVTNVTWANTTTGANGTAGFSGGTFTVPTHALNAGINNITVTAFDNAGNSSTDTIAITSDPTAPNLTITTPTLATTYATNASTVTLGGTASDGITSVSKVEYINTTTTAPPASLASGTTSWSTGAILLATGTNTINVIATDAAGNQKTNTINVIKDTQAPTVQINSPTVNPTYITNVSTVNLGGTASDSGLSGLVDVKWTNGATGGNGTASGTSTWTVNGIGLAAGANAITLTATDGAGNTGTAVITVTYDATPPLVQITGPTVNPTLITAGTTITLTGTASDSGGGAINTITWSTTGAVAPNSGVCTYVVGPPGTWSIPNPQVALATGAQTITITATDTAGNSATDTITVTRDNTNPSLTVTTPATSTSYTTAGTAALAGTASDASGITLVQYQVNGGALISASGTTTWSVASATLPSTTNNINIIATDGAGNTTTNAITIIKDTTAPGVGITTNGGLNFATNATPVALAGNASDNFVVASVQWQNNGGGYTNATGTGPWSASVPLTAGSNLIQVKATDGAGNTTISSITITLDQTPPTVTITGPTSNPNFDTAAASVTISGTVTDAGGAGVSTVNWSTTGSVPTTSGATTITTGTFTSTAAIQLATGSQTITVTATDLAGNTSTDTITVFKDNTNPTVSITTPGTNPFYTTSANVALAGTASDNKALQIVEYRVLPTATFTAASGTTSWSVAAAPLNVGSNTIEVRATDTSGNTFTASTVVVRDNTNPTATITTNSGADFTTNVTPLALAGTSADDVLVSSVAWSNNGSAYVAATGTTSWSASIPLAAGTNAITVRVMDAAGNIGTKTITVTYDSGAPQVNITSPTSSSTYVTGAASITLGGTASDASGIQKVEYRLVPAAFTLANTPYTSWTTPAISLAVGSNTIEIRATDNGNNPSTTSITVTRDTTAPTVAITGPTTNPTYATNAATLTLSGTVSDTGGGTVASVTWNNPTASSSGTATFGGGTWTATSATSLALGSQVITVTATDSVGNVSTTTLTVNRDTTIPTIAITSPTSPHIRNTTPVTVTGTASDGAGSGVSVVNWSRAEGGGASGSAGGTTSWTANVPLVVGTNTITFTAVDAASNTSTGAVLVVTLDQTAPTLLITGPTSNPTYATNAANITLSGTVSDAGGGTITSVDWSNPAGPSSGTSTIVAGNWTATTATTLAAGTNVITVTATDSAGNQTQKVLTVTKDNTIPTISITSPSSPAVVGTTSVAVNGTASDGAGSGVQSVTWSRAEGGGASGTATGTTSWSASVPLVVGVNTITFKSIDAATNQSTGSVLSVTLDQTGPTVAITGPVATPTYATKNNTLTLSGTVSDVGGGTVSTVNWSNSAGGSGTSTIVAGNWTATAATTLVLGSQVLTVTATDSVGNVSTTTLTVFYDNTNPTVSITSPTSAATFTTGANPITLGGSASDGAGSGLASVTWTNAATSGSGTATGTTSWSASVPLSGSGGNLITITATDLAGNTQTATITVTLNLTAPTLTITSPTSNSTYFTSAANITLGGTSIDSDGQIVGVAYTVNGGGSVAASGTFPGGTNTATPWTTGSIALNVGSNSIVVTATDNGSTTGSDTITVIRDNTNPTVVVTTNSGGNFTTKTSPVVLAGTASDNVGGSGLATVVWSNAATSGTGPAGSSSPWSANVPLTPGANLITFTATDNAGNPGTTTITVTYDVTAPAVAITAPSATGTYQTATTPLTTLAGTASDNVLVANVQYQVNGGAFTATGGTVANWNVPSIALNLGVNTINVRATDTAGNSTTATILVTMDNQNPTVAITSPTSAATYITNTTPIILAGTASDNLALQSVTWTNTLTGGFGTATGTNAWTATGVNLSPGVNPIQVKATDTLGNVSTVALLTVTYDSSVPTLAITAPTAGATYLTTAASVTLSGTSADNVAVATVTALNSANGAVGTPSGTTAWTITGIALVAGTNVITVTATDTAGNTATKTLTVTRDNTLPTVAITTPTSGPTYLAGSSPLSLAGTASDNVAVASVQWVNGAANGTATGTTAWTASIPLTAGSNTITVTSTDTAGNVSATSTLTVTYDNGAPAVAITTNSGANFATNLSPVSLAGTASDPQGIASVKWSNAATGGSGTAAAGWSTSVPLAIGGNAITITATDNAGNTSTALITVTLDTTVPTVTITGPTTSPTYVTTNGVISITGTTADNIGVASVSWSTDAAVAPNSGTATLGAGTFTIPTIDLAAGSQVITITALDTAGNSSTDTITVTRDNTNPTIAITSPTASGSYITGAASLVIGGTAADNLAVGGVAWTRTEGSLSGAAAGTTSWSATVPLQVGTNTFTFTSTDSALNNSAGAVIVVTRDNTLPAVQITGPTPNPTFTTGASPLAISGTASDADGIASVTWSNAKTGGSASAAFAAGAWTGSVPLAIGVNTITVSATDTAGNVATDSFDVTLDISPPTVTITSPTVASTFVQSGAAITLGGTASDNIGVATVTALNSANGSVGTPSGTTAWTVTGIALVAGPNVITVTATDTAGNSASSVITVTRDGTPPVLAITGPTAAPTYITNDTPIQLSGTSSDNVAVASISWSNSLGGSGAASGTANWSASIPLFSGDNIITVTSTDTAGGFSTAQITVTFDNTPPAVAINAPTAAPTYVTNIAPVLLGGTASDGVQLANVTWSNAATGGTGTATGTTTWSASVPLTNGLNVITVSANDTAGNSTTDLISVTFDATVPTIAIGAPTALPNYLTSASTVALGGSASDNVGVATVTCVNSANGAVGVVTGTTSWTVAPIALVAGDNTITVTVTDTAGNTNTDTITVKQDSVTPTVSITTPTSSGTAVTGSSPLAIGGTASDNVGVASVTWSNPLGVPSSGTATGTTTWTALVPIAAGGPNTITVTVTDTAGNIGTTTLTVTLDNTAPTIATTGPTNQPTYSTATSSVTVSGTASDAGGLSTITWTNGATGATGTATGTNNWSAAIALTPGVNLITITAVDAAGNTSISTITVIHDTQAPTVNISVPTSAANANSSLSPITIGGSASDNVGVTSVSWTNGATGGSGVATGTSAWSASVPLVEGNNQITVTAIDNVGNSASDTITVTYDPTLPTINITSPTTQATYATTVTPLDFTGTASDNLVLAGVTWANVTSGTTGNATGTTNWTASVPLQSGVNTIVFTATDGVGNLVTDTVDVTYDVTPPVVTIVSPTPPTLTTQTRPLLISGTASDNIGVSAVTWSNSLTGQSGAANFANPNWDASINMIPGTNIITIRAIDALGNIGVATLTVDYSHETVAPTITIDTPTTLPTFTSPSQVITVAGTASDNVGVTSVTWINRTTGVFGIATGTTAWSADIPLANGSNLIQVTASDDVGNTVFAQITITFTAPAETNPPTITITAPTTADTFNTTTSPLHLEANAIDDTGVVSVRWTNQGTFGDGITGYGAFWFADIPLASGNNVITVTATDTSGNTATDVITVNYNPPAGDPVPPLVAIVTPLASGTVNVSVPVVNVTGTASDNNKVDSVTFSNTTTGLFATAVGTTSWSASNVLLDPGVNVITARAIDPAGNVGQATLVVVYTPPAAAKPVAPVIPAGMCGCTGLEALVALGALLLGRRLRRRRA